MLPSAFPDGVGLHYFLYGAQSHGPTRSLSTLRLRVAPSPQDSLPAVPSALAGRAWLPAGFQLEVSAHGSILLNQTLAGAPGRSGDRESCEFLLLARLRRETPALPRARVPATHPAAATPRRAR